MNNRNQWRDEIQALVARCQAARASGISPEPIRAGVLSEAIESILSRLDAREFLDWVKDDREYAYFYYDSQQSGVCAKPREAAAIILEQIVMNAIE